MDSRKKQGTLVELQQYLRIARDHWRSSLATLFRMHRGRADASPQLAAALELLDTGDVTLFGLVLSNVPTSARSHYYSSYYYSASRPKQEEAAALR